MYSPIGPIPILSVMGPPDFPERSLSRSRLSTSHRNDRSCTIFGAEIAPFLTGIVTERQTISNRWARSPPLFPIHGFFTRRCTHPGGHRSSRPRCQLLPATVGCLIQRQNSQQHPPGSESTGPRLLCMLLWHEVGTGSTAWSHRVPTRAQSRAGSTWWSCVLCGNFPG